MINRAGCLFHRIMNSRIQEEEEEEMILKQAPFPFLNIKVFYVVYESALPLPMFEATIE